jgi:hypothetical protein
LVRAWQLDSVAQLVRALYRNRSAPGYIYGSKGPYRPNAIRQREANFQF